MTYDIFVADPFNPYALLLSLGLIVVVLGLVFLFMFGFTAKHKFGLLMSLTALLGLAGIAALLCHMQTISDGVKAQNRVTAESNLKKKYDIEGILWEKKNTYPESYDMTTIVVQDKENNILTFGYKIDPETREPQLLNDEEGNPTTIKSNDLLLNKSK